MYMYQKYLVFVLTRCSVGYIVLQVTLQRSQRQLEKREDQLESSRRVLEAQEAELDDYKQELEATEMENEILRRSMERIKDSTDVTQSVL